MLDCTLHFIHFSLMPMQSVASRTHPRTTQSNWNRTKERKRTTKMSKWLRVIFVLQRFCGLTLTLSLQFDFALDFSLAHSFSLPLFVHFKNYFFNWITFLKAARNANVAHFYWKSISICNSVNGRKVSASLIDTFAHTCNDSTLISSRFIFFN